MKADAARDRWDEAAQSLCTRSAAWHEAYPKCAWCAPLAAALRAAYAEGQKDEREACRRVNSTLKDEDDYGVSGW